MLAIRKQILYIFKNKSFRNNAFIATMSTMLSVVIGLISVPLITRLLSKEDYGSLSYVSSIESLIVACSGPGIANAISISVAREYDGTFRVGTYRRLKIYLRNSFITLPIAAWYLWIEGNVHIALLIVLLGVTLPWSNAFDTSEQFLIGRGDFLMIFWRRLISIVLLAASSVITAFFIPNAIAVFIVRDVVSTLSSLVIFFSLLRLVRNDQVDPKFWSNSRDLSLVSILGTIGGIADQLVLGKFGNLSTLAEYSLAVSLTSPLDSFSKSFIKIVFGRMSNRKSLSQRQSWVIFSLIIVAFGLPLVFFLWSLIIPVFLFMFPKYPQIINIIPWLLAGFIFSFASTLGHTHGLFHSYGSWTKYYWVKNASRVIVMLVGVYLMGVWGAVYIRLFYSIIDFVFFNSQLWFIGGKVSPVN